MIYYRKSQPAPEELSKEKQKSSGSYRVKEVMERVREDFYDKCYICGQKNPTNINVEHFRPHEGNRDLKFEWNNLFWSCSHCNNTKSNKYKKILNCTKKEDRVEESFRYHINPFPGAKIEITPLKEGEEIDDTLKLLNAVYNGTTDLKDIEAENIQKHLLFEIKAFTSLLWKHDSIRADEEYSRDVLMKIKQHLHDSSPFVEL